MVFRLFGIFLVLSLLPHAVLADGNVSVSRGALEAAGDVLPSRSNGSAAFVSSIYPNDLLVLQPTTVDVIFLHESAGWKNSLGYFTYAPGPSGAPVILDRQLIFPDVSKGPQDLDTGDYVTLKDNGGQVRVFAPGTRIGFFVVADGFRREPLIQNWAPETSPIPSDDPQVNAGFGKGCFTSIDAFNPENATGSAEQARHFVLLSMQGEPGFLNQQDFLLLGYEDMARDTRSDEDFNDGVFAIRGSAGVDAFDLSGTFRYEYGDPDGDGVSGTRDSYPQDPTRATEIRIPANSYHTVIVEDLYPNVGDSDYNDVVVAFHYVLVLDNRGRAKDLFGSFYLLARGAILDHRIGVHFKDIPNNASGNLKVERFLRTNPIQHQVESPTSVREFIRNGKRIDNLFPSTLPRSRRAPASRPTRGTASNFPRPQHASTCTLAARSIRHCSERPRSTSTCPHCNPTARNTTSISPATRASPVAPAICRANAAPTPSSIPGLSLHDRDPGPLPVRPRTHRHRTGLPRLRALSQLPWCRSPRLVPEPERTSRPDQRVGDDVPAELPLHDRSTESIEACYPDRVAI